jgi:NAD(P)-dependent dehydrogenase (short-subunit alcohol dehydrogenase family)
MAQHPAFERGRVAVITGAAGGIGLAAARRFRSFGMKVVLADTDVAEVEAAASELGEGGSSGDVIAVEADVSQLSDVERLRDVAWKRLGPVSVLMNNAGTGLGAFSTSTCGVSSTAFTPSSRACSRRATRAS